MDRRNGSDDEKSRQEHFRDVAVAEAEGYHLMFGRVSADDAGAMGLHYVNLPLVADDELDPARPEIVIYAPTPGGGLRPFGRRLSGVRRAWDAKGVRPPPLIGQLLLFGSPNRYGLPAFYALYVSAWERKPQGHVRELAPQRFLRHLQRTNS